MVDEGVIKFSANHERRPLEATRFAELVCKLAAWREVMAKTGLVGQRSGLYGGAGYGNVSARVGPPSSSRGQRAFLITGTQTGGKSCVDLADFCVVQRYDYRQGAVWSYGEIEPSSESMTHGAIYDLAPQLRVVLHAHTPAIWRQARRLRLPITDPAVPYGTPEMAREVQRLYRSSSLAESRVLAMGGHEDGVIVFGRSAQEAGQTMVATLARAYEAQCHEQGVGLCSITR